MTELGPNARGLIELARHEDDPDLAARERVQEALVARLNAGANAPLSAAKGQLGVKSAAVLAVLGAVVAGAGALYSERKPALDLSVPPSTIAAMSASPADVPSRLEQPPTVAREGKRTAAARPAVTLPEPEASSTRVREPRARVSGRRELERAPSVEPSTVGDAASAKRQPGDSHDASPTAKRFEPATRAGDALLAEARALREVQQVLRAGNAARALTLLAEQDREFANGQLGEARAAARAMARCASQSAKDSRNAAAAFEARWPRSIMLSSVRAACGSSGARAGIDDE